jgi:hypothetical protein
MKRITHPAGTFITGSAVADAILRDAARAVAFGTSATLDVPVLEANGTKSTRTLFLSPASQFEVADVDGAFADEDAQFPVPTSRPVVDLGDGSPAPTPEELERDAREFNRVAEELENGTGSDR